MNLQGLFVLGYQLLFFGGAAAGKRLSEHLYFSEVVFSHLDWFQTLFECCFLKSLNFLFVTLQCVLKLKFLFLKIFVTPNKIVRFFNFRKWFIRGMRPQIVFLFFVNGLTFWLLPIFKFLFNGNKLFLNDLSPTLNFGNHEHFPKRQPTEG